MERTGTVWRGQALYGEDRHCMERTGTVWRGQALYGEDRHCMERTQVWREIIVIESRQSQDHNALLRHQNLGVSAGGGGELGGRGGQISLPASMAHHVVNHLVMICLIEQCVDIT